MYGFSYTWNIAKFEAFHRNISLSANLLFLKSDIVNKLVYKYLQQLQPTICHCSVLTVKVKLLIWRLSDLEILYYCIFSSKYNLDSSCSCREMLLSCISTFLLSPHTVFIWNTDNKYYIENISYSIEQGSEKRTLCLM